MSNTSKIVNKGLHGKVRYINSSRGERLGFQVMDKNKPKRYWKVLYDNIHIGV